MQKRGLTLFLVLLCANAVCAQPRLSQLGFQSVKEKRPSI